MSDFSLRSDFKASQIKIVQATGRNPKWAYIGEFKGKKSLHLREVFQDDNEDWCPGKGTSLPLNNELAIVMMAALDITNPEAPVAAVPAKSPRKLAGVK